MLSQGMGLELSLKGKKGVSQLQSLENSVLGILEGIPNANSGRWERARVCFYFCFG